ncbi:MAG: phosphoglycolate phosphatase [Gammaproteobacteria bacterium]
MAALRLVVFDLDGTLIDSVPDLAVTVDLMCRELAVHVPGAGKVRQWVGDGVRRLVKRALTGSEAGEPEVSLYRRGMQLFQRFYLEHLSEHTRPYPEVRAVLDRLQGEGFALACVTNKSGEFTGPLLEALDLRRYFGVVVSGDTLAERKPSPLPLLYVSGKLAVAPAAACMVGDSANDIRAAHAAGFVPVAVSYGYGNPVEVAAAGPEIVLATLDELPPWLAAHAPTLAARTASR